MLFVCALTTGVIVCVTRWRRQNADLDGTELVANTQLKSFTDKRLVFTDGKMCK